MAYYPRLIFPSFHLVACDNIVPDKGTLQDLKGTPDNDKADDLGGSNSVLYHLIVMRIE